MRMSSCGLPSCSFLLVVALVLVITVTVVTASDDDSSSKFAVIFDAGSTGSRVHVFRFGDQLKLLNIGDDVELFVQTKPGLSAYASDPQQAANSLLPLLEKAESVIPSELRPDTPVRVGATAGLRLLGDETANKILQAVRGLIQKNSTLKYRTDWVSVLDGSQEGSYLWVTINYMLGNLGKKYSSSVATVDLGGGSIQMAYAISSKAAADAPQSPTGEESYVKKLYLNSTFYDLYVHSYLNYGLLAARAETLKTSKYSYSYCILGGYTGTYTYNGNTYKANSSPKGPNFSKCQTDILNAIKIDKACNYTKCTFNGEWNGGGGDGQKKVYAASFFYSITTRAGFVDSAANTAVVRPADFLVAAKKACKMNINDVKTSYPLAEETDLPFMCMDLVYEYTLLVDGFGLKLGQKITVVDRMQYDDASVDISWALGSAIDVVSSSTDKSYRFLL